MDVSFGAFDSRQVASWLGAMLSLLVASLATWIALANERAAGHILLKRAFDSEANESERELFNRGFQSAAVLFLTGGGTLVASTVAGLTSYWPNYVAWPVFGMGAGLSVTGGVVLFGMLWARTRYQLLRRVHREYLGSLSEDKLKDIDIAQQAKRERAEILFERNREATFVIKELAFVNTGIFEGVSWNPSPRINIMLGRNGYGKSYLLRLMVGLLSYDNDRLTELVGGMGSGFNMRLKLLRNGKPVKIEHDGRAFDESTGKVPLLAIPDSRFLNRARPSVGSDRGDYADMARHGSHHFLYDQPFESTIETVLAEMCIDVIGNEGSNKRYPESPQLQLIEEVLFDLSAERFRFQSISPIGSARFSIMVETEASPGTPIAIQKASQGTLSIITIFSLIYQYLRQVHRDVPQKKLRDQPAIVLIDEIDAHLHPSWQGKIVHLLRQHFPNVQFILTAHSPLVVAGCGSGEICVLRRIGRSFCVEEFQRDFMGSSVVDIYREIFGVDERDDEFVKYYAQLPIVQNLERELEALRSMGHADAARIDRVETELSRIKRTSAQEEKELKFETLQRENEQLKRQLSSVRNGEQR